MTTTEGKLVGTEKVNVNIYEYEDIEWIEYRPNGEYDRYDGYDYCDTEKYPASCSWGKGNIIKYDKTCKTIGHLVGKSNIDLTDIKDIKLINGILHFKTPKTIRVYQHITKEDGESIFIKVY